MGEYEALRDRILSFTTVGEWEEAASSVRRLYAEQVYGRVPEAYHLRKASTRQGMNGEEIWEMEGEGVTLSLFVSFPDRSEAVPVMLIPLLYRQPAEMLPRQLIHNRGAALAWIEVHAAAPDIPACRQGGVYTAWRGRKDFDETCCGALAVWAWALAEAACALKSDPRVNAVHLVGHSRGGKAALWAAGAYRVFDSCSAVHSGCCGASCFRSIPKGMENVREITRQFPWWFSDTLASYSERMEELPVEQELLLSLAAPAKLLVLSRDRDPYCDAQAEEKSVHGARHAFTLYGMHPVYHLTHGGHEFVEDEWQFILNTLVDPQS